MMSVSNYTTILAEDIIASAKEYRVRQNRKMTMEDYERFKQQLYQYGHYGYEQALATALKI